MARVVQSPDLSSYAERYAQRKNELVERRGAKTGGAGSSRISRGNRGPNRSWSQLRLGLQHSTVIAPLRRPRTSWFGASIPDAGLGTRRASLTHEEAPAELDPWTPGRAKFASISGARFRR